MSYGSIPQNLTVKQVSENLIERAGIDGNEDVGMDAMGRLVTRRETEGSEFKECQERMTSYLLDRRTVFAKKLSKRKVNVVVPDDPKLWQVKNAIAELAKAETGPGSPASSPTEQRSPVHSKALVSVKADLSGVQIKLFDAVKKTLSVRLTDDQILKGIRQNTFEMLQGLEDQEWEGVLTEYADHFVGNIQQLQTFSQVQRPDPLVVQQSNLNMQLQTACQSSEQLEDTLQLIVAFMGNTEQRQSARENLQPSCAHWLNTALKTFPGKFPHCKDLLSREMAKAGSVGGYQLELISDQLQVSSAHAPSKGASATVVDTGELSDAAALRLNQNNQYSITSSGAAHSMLHYLGKYPEYHKEEFCHPLFVVKARELAEKVKGSAAFGENEHVRKAAAGLIASLPDNAYKKMLAEVFGDAVVERSESRLPFQEVPKLERKRPSQPAPLHRTEAGSPRPLPRQRATAGEKLAKEFGLASEVVPLLTSAFPGAAVSEEARATMALWKKCREMNAGVPLGTYLDTVKSQQSDVLHLLALADKDLSEFKKRMTPVLRESVVRSARFGPVSSEAAEDLTQINLWYDARLFDEISTLEKMSEVHRALSMDNQPMRPDDLMFALSDQKIGKVQERLYAKLPDPRVLADTRHQAAENQTIRVVARVIGDRADNPSYKTINLCQDLVRLLGNNMNKEEYEEKKDELYKALEDISYAFLPIYLENPRSLSGFIAGALNCELNDGRIEYLCNALEKWYQASLRNESRHYLETLPADAQRDLMRVYHNMADASVMPLGSALQQLEPLPEASRQLRTLMNQVKDSRAFMGKGRQKAINEKVGEIGLQTGPRTIADGNCGYASVSLLNGNHPQEVRDKTKKAAEDMKRFQETGSLDDIQGDAAYRRRVITAVESFKHHKELMGMEMDPPAVRARYVGINPSEQDIPKGTRSTDYWLFEEDLQYLAVAYGVPVIQVADPLSKEGGGDQHIARFVTPDGAIHFCWEKEDYDQALALLDPANAPLTMVKMGDFDFSHWMPLVPVPGFKPRQNLPPQLLSPAAIQQQSLAQRERDEQQYLSLSLNPAQIPAGQKFVVRPPSPSYDETPSLPSLQRGGHEGYPSLIQQVREEQLQLPQGQGSLSSLGAIGPESSLVGGLQSAAEGLQPRVQSSTVEDPEYHGVGMTTVEMAFDTVRNWDHLDEIGLLGTIENYITDFEMTPEQKTRLVQELTVKLNEHFLSRPLPLDYQVYTKQLEKKMWDFDYKGYEEIGGTDSEQLPDILDAFSWAAMSPVVQKKGSFDAPKDLWPLVPEAAQQQTRKPKDYQMKLMYDPEQTYQEKLSGMLAEKRHTPEQYVAVIKGLHEQSRQTNVFFNTKCGLPPGVFRDRVLPRLQDGSLNLREVGYLVSTGDPEKARQFLRRNGIDC